MLVTMVTLEKVYKINRETDPMQFQPSSAAFIHAGRWALLSFFMTDRFFFSFLEVYGKVWESSVKLLFMPPAVITKSQGK